VISLMSVETNRLGLIAQGKKLNSAIAARFGGEHRKMKTNSAGGSCAGQARGGSVPRQQLRPEISASHIGIPSSAGAVQRLPDRSSKAGPARYRREPWQNGVWTQTRQTRHPARRWPQRSGQRGQRGYREFFSNNNSRCPLFSLILAAHALTGKQTPDGIQQHVEAVGPGVDSRERRLSATPFPAIESKVRDVKEQPPSVADARTLHHRNVLPFRGPTRGPWTFHVNSMGRRNRTLNDPDPPHAAWTFNVNAEWLDPLVARRHIQADAFRRVVTGLQTQSTVFHAARGVLQRCRK
jgi:hypothetical protein